jgi:predicted O-methyltransferase YrrM
LEIGTFVGTSAISILQYLPNAIIQCIDNWDVSDKTTMDILHKNIELSGYASRIKLCNCDNISNTLLYEVVNQTSHETLKYDFVRIDGNIQSAINYQIDCFLAWNLLKIGGIMTICHIEGEIDFLMDEIFIQKFTGGKSHYEIIHSNSHICLRKI